MLLVFTPKKGITVAETLYWHDYETFGTDPARDRPAQFAGQRTDLDLNPIGEPLVLYCKPAGDTLPHPEACLVTGITPQLAFAKGVIEAEFIKQIHNELAKPNTCTVGYNNLRFDDEFTRYTLYRNFYDPYAREYRNNNSRWDIIDMVRMCYALRPEGIEWPKDENGIPRFKLENLSAANGLSHESAHDALSDVNATIALAKLIKTRQPKLYEFAFKLRNKQEALNSLNVKDMQPIVHTSNMFANQYACTSVVVPVALHPQNKNGVIVYDLRYDPTDLINADSKEISTRLFTRSENLPDGIDRIHLKTIHANKSPMIAPMNVLNDAALQRIQIELEQVENHLAKIQQADGLAGRIREALQKNEFESHADPELNLYGGFFGDMDRDRIEQIRRASPDELIGFPKNFDDARLPELLFRYRARNWPETLSQDELTEWEEYRRNKLTDKNAGGSITLTDFDAMLEVLGQIEGLTEEQMQVLEDLAEWSAMIAN
ncbi:MAG: exodeoxyribonuclease I [Gammaproteobacteria bacterium]|nr:exodeoxyribonuclease I [Gammaproteobacteria bacterium]